MIRNYVRGAFLMVVGMVCAFAPQAWGQEFTGIQALNVVVDEGGGSAVHPPAGTQLCFLGTNKTGVPITYTPAGGTPTSGTICQSLTSGGSLAGGLSVANTATASPFPLYYTITVVNGATVYLTIPLVQVAGNIWSWDSFALAANGTASGIGFPHLGCSIGSQFASTSLPPGQNSFLGAEGQNACSWSVFPVAPYCSAGKGYLPAQVSGNPLCLAPETSGLGAPSGFCVQGQKYTQIDAAAGAFAWGCVNNAWQNAGASGGGNAITGLFGDGSATGPGNVMFTLSGFGTAGTYYKVVTDSKGRVSSGSTTLGTIDLPFTYSGNTTELATVSGSLPGGSIVSVDGNGNLTPATSSSVFPGTIAAARVTGLAPSATIDTTNASNITSGTLDAARLPATIASNTTGNAATATALANNPAGCPSGQVATGILADGTPTCVSGGGSGNNVASPQFTMAYYFNSGTDSTIKGDPNVTTDGAGNIIFSSSNHVYQANTPGVAGIQSTVTTAGTTGSVVIPMSNPVLAAAPTNSGGGGAGAIVPGSGVLGPGTYLYTICSVDVNGVQQNCNPNVMNPTVITTGTNNAIRFNFGATGPTALYNVYGRTESQQGFIEQINVNATIQDDGSATPGATVQAGFSNPNGIGVDDIRYGVLGKNAPGLPVRQFGCAENGIADDRRCEQDAINWAHTHGHPPIDFTPAAVYYTGYGGVFPLPWDNGLAPVGSTCGGVACTNLAAEPINYQAYSLLVYSDTVLRLNGATILGNYPGIGQESLTTPVGLLLSDTTTVTASPTPNASPAWPGVSNIDISGGSVTGFMTDFFVLGDFYHSYIHDMTGGNCGFWFISQKIDESKIRNNQINNCEAGIFNGGWYIARGNVGTTGLDLENGGYADSFDIEDLDLEFDGSFITNSAGADNYFWNYIWHGPDETNGRMTDVQGTSSPTVGGFNQIIPYHGAFGVGIATLTRYGRANHDTKIVNVQEKNGARYLWYNNSTTNGVYFEGGGDEGAGICNGNSGGNVGIDCADNFGWGTGRAMPGVVTVAGSASSIYMNPPGGGNAGSISGSTSNTAYSNGVCDIGQFGEDSNPADYPTCQMGLTMQVINQTQSGVGTAPYMQWVITGGLAPSATNNDFASPLYFFKGMWNTPGLTVSGSEGFTDLWGFVQVENSVSNPSGQGFGGVLDIYSGQNASGLPQPIGAFPTGSGGDTGFAVRVPFLAFQYQTAMAPCDAAIADAHPDVNHPGYLGHGTWMGVIPGVIGTSADNPQMCTMNADGTYTYKSLLGGGTGTTINGASGAITFNGAAVTQVGNTFTFNPASGVAVLAANNTFTGTLNTFNGETAVTLGGATSFQTGTASLANQGSAWLWNQTGSTGETDLVNYKGGGSGGFNFYNTTDGGGLGSPIASIDASGDLGMAGSITASGHLATNTSVSGFAAGTSGGFGEIVLIDSAGATNGKLADFVNIGTDLQGRFMNDANTTAINWMDVSHSGETPTGISFNEPLVATQLAANNLTIGNVVVSGTGGKLQNGVAAASLAQLFVNSLTPTPLTRIATGQGITSGTSLVFITFPSFTSNVNCVASSQNPATDPITYTTISGPGSNGLNIQSSTGNNAPYSYICVGQ
jgi:hypothetical protein